MFLEILSVRIRNVILHAKYNNPLTTVMLLDPIWVRGLIYKFFHKW